MGRGPPDGVAFGISALPRLKDWCTVVKPSRDVETVPSIAEAVAKLRRLADALETEQPFRIQVAGERIRVPARAQFSIEHERGEDEEEIELQLKWTLEGQPDESTDEPVV